MVEKNTDVTDESAAPPLAKDIEEVLLQCLAEIKQCQAKLNSITTEISSLRTSLTARVERLERNSAARARKAIFDRRFESQPDGKWGVTRTNNFTPGGTLDIDD